MSPYDQTAVARQRERFAAGQDRTTCVRTEIVQSWARCRDLYDVDPDLPEAPPASDEPALGLELEVVLAELAGIARAQRADLAPAVVTVVDATGRLIAEWGDVHTQRQMAEANLAPWAAWSEASSGTNGMGTALAGHGVTTVRGPEHWCAGFQRLDCAGIAAHDPVTDEPLGAMNVSTYDEPLPNRAFDMLLFAAQTVERILTARAWHWADALIAAFRRADDHRSAPIVALDLGGKVVTANERGAHLVGVSLRAPAIDPATRAEIAEIDVSYLSRLVARAVERGHDVADWTGATLLTLPTAAEPVETSVAPVFSAGHPVGALLIFGCTDGEPLTMHTAIPVRRQPLHRIVARRAERNVLLDPGEIRYAEADRNTVWLHTDRGRLRAATRGLHNVEAELGDGFLRVHRRYVVNIVRVRELERGFKGGLLLVTDVRDNEVVPVARARAHALRHRLGI